ncbi:MAG: phosphatase PAP2 family protein [Acidimicrobiales bacterium]
MPTSSALPLVPARRPLSTSEALVDGGLVAIGLALFTGTAAVARRREVGPTEHQVFTTINDLPAALHAPTWALMQAGSLGAAPVVAGLVWWSGRRRTAVGAAVVGLVAWGLPKLAKKGVRRGRPAAHLDGVQVRGQEQRGLGFPSGHAAVSTALGVTIGPSLPLPARLAALAIALEVSGARMYVGAHLPLDIAGGIGLGLTLGGITNLVLGERSHEHG